MNKINKRIQKIRKNSKYKQSEVAALLHINTGTYSKKERDGKFTGEDLILLADFFKVDVREFLYDDVESIKPIIIIPEECYILNDREGHIITMYRNTTKERQKEMFEFIYNTFKAKRRRKT